MKVLIISDFLGAGKTTGPAGISLYLKMNMLPRV